MSIHACIHVQKLTDRKAALNKKNFKKPDDRKKWEKILHTEMMSSEDSCEEDHEEVLKVKILPWRGEIVNRMFTDLDFICKKEKSPQGIRQQKPRKLGETSIRPAPLWAPEWALKKP